MKVVLGPNKKAPNLSEDDQPVLSIKILLPGKLLLSKLEFDKSIAFLTPRRTPPLVLSLLQKVLLPDNFVSCLNKIVRFFGSPEPQTLLPSWKWQNIPLLLTSKLQELLVLNLK